MNCSSKVVPQALGRTREFSKAKLLSFVDKKNNPAMTMEGRFQPYGLNQLGELGVLDLMPQEVRFEFDVVSAVLPFRVNRHVVGELIDWSRVPDDPVYKSLFPNKDMLPDWAFERVAREISEGGDPSRLEVIVGEVRRALNPHPGGQTTDNVAQLGGESVPGLQHKYAQTVLFFPPQAQTCHSYCAYCFRWAQFTGKETRMQTRGVDQLHRYLKQHSEVSDLLMTGGDPMVMKTTRLSEYLLPLCKPEYAHIRNIRLGTKSLTFWPQRFVTDSDADDLLRVLEKLVGAGKHVALMAHVSHWQEMSPTIFEKAVARIQQTGAIIRTQSPLLANVNDTSEIWSRMWQDQVRLGIVPYYMFVERDTGANRYFELPLVKAWEIYRDALSQVSGLARTAKGPVMSCHPGKVEIQGTAVINGEKVFVLRFIQARDPGRVQQPFFARFNASATWYDQLEPVFGRDAWFAQKCCA